MTKTIVLFNNKGGVGKTTFLFHLGYALERLGKKILFVNADPQCSLTSYICTNDEIEKYWNSKCSLYNVIEPLVKGSGDIKEVSPYIVKDRNIRLIVGDVLLSSFEPLLSSTWVESLAGEEKGFRISSAIYRAFQKIASDNTLDYVLIDVGPNLGSLNRSILLSCDYFLIPIIPDMFSLRGLSNIGSTFSKWIINWADAKKRFEKDVETLPFGIQSGRPAFAGIINQQFNISGGKITRSFKYWADESKPVIEEKIINVFEKLGDDMLVDLNGGSYQLGDFKNYHGLAADSQKYKKPISELKGVAGVNPGNAHSFKTNESEFRKVATRIIEKT
ncbi:MAG: AAA family ATPase [Candidatus Nitrosoabyssus spongiisocia]|nr:MAG: AAA family ATPase [Nitrosopumilaceae archaeon AB1(1)]